MSFHPARTFVLYRSLFQLSISVIFATVITWLARLGLTAGEIALCQVVCVATGTLAEVPTGMLADGKSRAWSIRIGLIIVAAGTLLYGFATGLKSAMLSELVAAIGFAFISGADEAWLTDALKRRGEAESLGRVLSTASLSTSLITIGGGLLGAIIASRWLAAPWFLSTALMLVALAFAIWQMDDAGEPPHRVSEIEALRRSLRAMRGSRHLAWALAATVAYHSVIAFNLYWPLRFGAVGQAGLGGLWVIIYGGTAASAYLTRRFSPQWHGRETVLIIGSFAFIGVGLAAAGLVDGLAAALTWIVIHEIGRGLFAPPISALTQRHVESEFRATFGSLRSLFGRGGETVSGLTLAVVMGQVAPTVAGINHVWLLYGLGLTAAGVALWLVRPRLS
jgi:DHA3 family tetracycline resistance protein-like MFS transporter